MSKVPRSARPAARADEDEAFFSSSKKITVTQSKCKTKRTTTVNMGAAAGTSSRTRGKETGKQVDTSPSCGGLRDSDRLRAGAAFLALSVVVVAMTWYWDAEEGDGADETLRRTWGTRLPRISYMGANLPAYPVFATLVPIGCLIVRAPLIRAIDRVVAFAGTCLPAAAVEHMQCSCTCCCCCCCGCAGCDADMTAGDRAIREQLAAGASMLATTVATQQPGETFTRSNLCSAPTLTTSPTDVTTPTVGGRERGGRRGGGTSKRASSRLLLPRMWLPALLARGAAAS